MIKEKNFLFHLFFWNKPCCWFDTCLPFATYLKIIVAIKMGVVCINYSILPKVIAHLSFVSIKLVFRSYVCDSIKNIIEICECCQRFLFPFVYINPFTIAFVTVLHQKDLFFYKLTPNANKMYEIRIFLPSQKSFIAILYIQVE